MITKNIIISGIILLLLSACGSKTNVKINGEIKEAGKQKIYLSQLNVDNTIIVDSTETNKKGQFSFKTAVTTPTLYAINVGNKESVTIIAEPDKQIEITGTFDNLKNNYWVDGSESSLWIKLLNFQLNNTRIAMDSLRKAYIALPESEATQTERNRIANEWDSIVTKQTQFSRDFILKNAVSPASYYALYQKLDNENFVLSPATDLHSFKIVATSLKAMYPESQYTVAILKHLDQINKELKNQRMRNLIVNAESDLPAIKLPNIHGDSITLHSLKGKYIILDFCVLSTPQSKVYVKELQTIYNKFKSKGVEIYQVCLDPNTLQWEAAVKDLGIPWTCVRDDESTKSRVALTWNVTTVPTNYIINKQFEIVGKNLSGQRLIDRLNDIVK